MATIVKIETPKGPIEWSVADHKMGLLVGFLDVLGYRGKKEYQQPEKCPNCEEFYFGNPAKIVRDCGQVNCADCGRWLTAVESVKKHQEPLGPCPNCEGPLYPYKLTKVYNKGFCPDCGRGFMAEDPLTSPQIRRVLEDITDRVCRNKQISEDDIGLTRFVDRLRSLYPELYKTGGE